MPILKIENNKLKQLKSSNFRNEKELQDLFEYNLEEIFGIKFIASEVQTGEKHGGRIDTLGVDENNSAVIIEYKWGEKDNVINQGLFYLDWLVDHRGDFQILVEKKLGKKVKIDWGQPRLILVASSFNKYDKHAINRMAENIELWNYTFYESGILDIEMEASSSSDEKRGRQITRIDYSQYDLNYHLNKTSKELQEKFKELRERILELPGTQERSEQRSSISYRTTKCFANFTFRRNSLDLLLRQPKYHDPQKLVRDVTSFAWGYRGLVKIVKESDVSYILNLIKQSYEETL